jgi:hypothetical protein|tara:strand:- start:468 stop:782 length:315 start_codon:yes stop_codon:yes gene_type:complete
MNNMEITIIISAVLNIVLIYTTFNLLKKNEKQEDVMAGYLMYMDQLSKTVEYAQEKLDALDTKGAFEGDDEIGWFFQSIKQLQGMLSRFKLIEENGTKEESKND